jgi:hypothetical protein
MTDTFIGVRDVNQETFRRFKAAMLRRDMKLGIAITKAMEAYIEQNEKQEKPSVQNLLKIKPFKIGKKVRWSKEIDNTLYEEK